MTVPRVLFEGLGDITNLVVFAETELDIAAQGEASMSTMVIRDTGEEAHSFLTGKRVTIDLAGDVVWAGYLIRADRQFWFDADTETTTNRRWTLTLADINLLFSKRVVFKQSAPQTIEGPSYRDPTYDNDIIDDLLAGWIDLSADDLDTTTLVEQVGIVNPSSGSCNPPDQNFYPWQGSMQWGEAMEVISQIPAAIWGLLPGQPLGTSPFGRLFYTDVDNEDAPFDLSDQPGASGESATEPFSTDGTDGWPGWTYDYGTASYASVSSGTAKAVIPYPSGSIGQYRDLLSIEGATEWSMLMRFRIDAATHLDPSLYIYLSGFEIDFDIYPFPSPDMFAAYSLYSPDESVFLPEDVPWDGDWRFAEVLVAGGVAELRVWKDGDTRPTDPTLTCAATTPAAPVYSFGNALYFDIVMSSDSGDPEDGTYEIDYITLTKVGGSSPVVGYHDMVIWEDGSNLTNESFAWGAAKTIDHMVFDQRVDAGSITDHGLWQQGDLIFNIWCQDTIEKVTDSIVNGSPSSRRGHKNPITMVELTTETDGFRVGQKARFINGEFSVDQVLPIRRVTMSFPTPDHITYKLSLSEAYDRWGFENAPLKYGSGPGGGGGGGEGDPPVIDCGITDSFHRVGAPGTSDAGIDWVEINGNDPDPSGLSYDVVGDGLVITADDTSVEFGSIDLPMPVDEFEATFIVRDYPTDLSASVSLQSPGIDASAYVSFKGTFDTFTLYDSGNDATSFDYDGNPFKVKVRYTNLLTQAKIWYTSDAEPADWMVTCPAGSRTLSPALGFEFDGFTSNGDSAKIQQLQVWEIFDNAAVFAAAMFDNFDRNETGTWGSATPAGEDWTGPSDGTYHESSVEGAHGRLWTGASGGSAQTGSNNLSIPVPLDLGRQIGIAFKMQFVTLSETSNPPAFWTAGETKDPFISFHLDGATSGEAFLGFTLGDTGAWATAQQVVINSGSFDWTHSTGAWYNVELRYRGSVCEVRLWLEGTLRPDAATFSVNTSSDDPIVGDLTFNIEQRQATGSSPDVIIPEFEVWMKDLRFWSLTQVGLMINRCYGAPTACWVNPPYALDNFNRALSGSTGDTSWGHYIWIDNNPGSVDLSVAGRWQVDINEVGSFSSSEKTYVELPLDPIDLNVNLSVGIELPDPPTDGESGGIFRLTIGRVGDDDVWVELSTLKRAGVFDWSSQLIIHTPGGSTSFPSDYDSENGALFTAAGLAVTITSTSVAASAGGLTGSRSWSPDTGLDSSTVTCILEMRGDLDNNPSFPADNSAFHVWAETLRVTSDLGNCVDVPRVGA